MTAGGTLLFVAPDHWSPVKEALVQAIPDGTERVHSLLGGRPSYGMYDAFLRAQKERSELAPLLDRICTAGGIDLRRCVDGVQPDPVIGEQLAVLPHKLGLAWTIERLVELLVQTAGLRLVVTTCTYDVFGRALLSACQQQRLPLVHLEHACSAIPPEDATHLRDTPGDVVLVPGQREVEWWRRCRPDVPVVVTGHPLWDGYATMARRMRAEDALPTVLWACASGANDWQTPRTWASRVVPELAWGAFRHVLQHFAKRTRVILLLRSGEVPELVTRWTTQAGDAARWPAPGCHPLELVVSSLPPAEVLPDADVLICQDSNLGIEAMTLGIPVICLTRDGHQLYGPESGSAIPTIKVTPGTDTVEHVGSLLRGAIVCCLGGLVETDWHGTASYYNAGVDGHAMERVCAAVRAVLETGRLVPADEAAEAVAL